MKKVLFFFVFFVIFFIFSFPSYATTPDCNPRDYDTNAEACKPLGQGTICVNDLPGTACHASPNGCPDGYNATGIACSGAQAFYCCIPIPTSNFASNECGDANTPANLGCLVTAIFPGIIRAAVVFSGSIILFLLIFSGFRFLTSGGDAKQVEGARKTLQYAFIGLAIILFSFLLLNVVATITGIDCLRTFTFTQCQ